MSSQNTKITKTLSTFSERVKMIDMHPREPLVICSLFSGQITLWNYDTMTLVKTFEVVDQPIRCVKFITRLQSFACGADDMAVRVYNYNTMEKTKTFAAHDDYIRSIGVHDQMPLMITSSDDMRIKGWDWTKDWACTMIFEGHTHYVMMVAFNPKEPLTFASASLDQTVKVWNVSNPEPFFSLNGHEDGVNCVEYYPKGDKPYLISGSDDHTVKVWDYQTRACIQTLTHHVHNVTCVFFHPDVPLLFSGSEDETIGVINTQTWRQEQTMNMGMQRAWTIAARPNTNAVAIGFDRGMIVLKVGNDVPILSMDANGKLYQALGNEVVRMDIKNVPADTADGETVRFAVKELGNCESAPTAIYHGPSGQYVAVLTEAGEFTIYSTLAWRPKTFGQCTSFVWGMDSSSYAILEGDLTLKMFKGFKQAQTVRLREPADKLFAGPVLGVRSSGAITFYTWDTQRVVRRVEGTPSHVLWSDSNELVALVMENGLFILRYNADDVAEHFANGGEETEEGLEVAFTVVDEVVEKVRQAVWVGDCLAFVNSNDRLNYYIGGEVTNIAVVGRQTYLLGFLPKENRLFCIDKERNVTSYLLHVSVIEYKTAIVREDFETAAEILPCVPASAKDKVAQFLQARGHLELALEVATEDDHRFELAVQLGRLEVAIAICRKIPSSFRWKQIGDLALENGAFDIAEQAMLESGDYNGLLLLYTSTGDMGGMEKLAALALAKGKTNVAFTCCHLANKYDECTDILVQTGRIADAAFYARTYCHSKVQDVVLKWKNSVAGLPRVRESIADPVGFPNLFPGMSSSLEQQASASPPQPQSEKEQTPSPDKVRSPVKQQQQTPAASAFDNYRKDSTFSEESPASPPPTPYTGVKPPDARAPPPSAATAAAIAAAAVGGTTATPKTPADLFSPAPPKAPQVTPATAYRTTEGSPDDTATPMIVKAARTAAEETAGKLEYDSPGKRAPSAGEGSVPRPAAPLAKHKKDDDAPRPPPKHIDPVADDDLDAMLGEDDTIAQKYAPKAAGSVGATKSASPTSPSGVAAASHVAVSSGSPRQPLPPASDTDEDIFKEDEDWQ